MTPIPRSRAATSNEQWSWGGGGGWGGGGWGGGGGGTTTYSLQTIAFNLNINKNDDNNFYFDDISWDSLPLDTEAEPTKESEDGKFDVAATTNYKFRLYQDGYLPSVPVTRSYIQTSNQYTIPIVSIVGDEKYFTDDMWGIDVVGTNGKPGNGSTDAVSPLSALGYDAYQTVLAAIRRAGSADKADVLAVLPGVSCEGV